MRQSVKSHGIRGVFTKMSKELFLNVRCRLTVKGQKKHLLRGDATVFLQENGSLDERRSFAAARSSYNLHMACYSGDSRRLFLVGNFGALFQILSNPELNKGALSLLKLGGNDMCFPKFFVKNIHF